MLQRKSVLRYVLVLLTLSVCMALTLGAVHPSFAQRTTSTTVTATDFYVPSGIDPWGTTFDSSGNVWLAVPGCDPSTSCSTSTPPGKIEVYSPSSASWTQMLQLPSGYAQAFFLAVDKKGRLWFPAPNNNALEMYNTTSHTFHKWKVPTPDAQPWDVTIDRHGKVWFSEYFYPLLCGTCGAHTSGISVDSNGNIWFDDSLQSIFGSFTASGTGSFSLYNTPTSNSHPHDGLNIDGQNRIWFDEEFANKLAQAIQ